MKRIVFDPTFAAWQREARLALAANIPPEALIWQQASACQEAFDFSECVVLSPKTPNVRHLVPKSFVTLAQCVACHSHEKRWALLYRVLWRITHGEPHLMKVYVDRDVNQLSQMEKSVRRDLHKMRAFLRFREVKTELGAWFVSWYEPEHRIVEMNAPFFVGRFASMRWSICTPDKCAHWDKASLHFTPGVKRVEMPDVDGTEALWRTYYANIFNPSRVKVRAMQAEMPKRYWKNLPEAQIIPSLLKKASTRVDAMMHESEMHRHDDEHKVPQVPRESDLVELRKLAAGCEACPLFRNATQTVFGEGPSDARIVIVGEQPGDQEDLQGKPFVGPAGKLLDRALKAAGIDRGKVYLTNAVKHFKWEPRGKRRLHQKPGARDIASCHPWLEAELAAIKPKRIICLGSTAAQAILGSDFRVSRGRVKEFRSDLSASVFATVHPSSLLRMRPGANKESEFEDFVRDLRSAVA